MLDLTAALRKLLQDVQNVAISMDIVLPDRRFVTVGGVVYDCEQVSVSGDTILPQLAGVIDTAPDPVYACDPIWHTNADVSIVRKSCNTPGGRRGTTPPTVEQ